MELETKEKETELEVENSEELDPENSRRTEYEPVTEPERRNEDVFDEDVLVNEMDVGEDVNVVTAEPSKKTDGVTTTL